VKSGNGVYATGAVAANTGGGVIDAGQVMTPSALTGHTYQISFTSSSTYDVLDTTPPGTTVSSANAYASGDAISFDGMQMSIQGLPAAGGKFTVSPSINQSVFTTLQQLITVLQTSANTPAANAALGNGLNVALQNIDRHEQGAHRALQLARERNRRGYSSRRRPDTQYQGRYDFKTLITPKRSATSPVRKPHWMRRSRRLSKSPTGLSSISSKLLPHVLGRRK
jgi:hypothetical protein